MTEENKIQEDDFGPSLDDDEAEDAEVMQAITNTTRLAQMVVKAVQGGDLQKAKQLHAQMVNDAPKKAWMHQDTKEYAQMRKWAHHANKQLYGHAQESLEIDLNQFKMLNEFSVLSMMGGWVEILLDRMFGGSSIPVNIKGPKSSVDAFARTLGAEKRYIEALKKNGLDDPASFKSKSALDKAISQFTKTTGIQWPFGD